MSWPLALRREVAGPLLRHARATLDRGRRLWSGKALGPLIAPGFARRLDLKGRMRDANFEGAWVRGTDEERRLAILLPGVTSAGAIYQALGAAHGVDVRDPTGDVRVLEFCFGVPPDQFGRGDRDRWLMRRALEGLVPPEVRLNRRRGVQDADIAHRLRAHADQVTAAVTRMEASPLSRAFLDVPGLRERWNVVRRDPTSAAARPARELTRGLSFGHFLTRFD
jgi:asparagine synthase (glutamine-hydrolysing)